MVMRKIPFYFFLLAGVPLLALAIWGIMLLTHQPVHFDG